MKNMFQIRLCQWLAGIVLTTSAVACTDTLENPLLEAPKEQGVPVELSFGFADEDDGYTLGGGADTRSGKDVQTEGFSAQLMPHVQTRAGEDLKPDGLYELHVNQYDLNGNIIKTNYTSGKTELGKKLTFTLTQVEDCQLLVIVRGLGNTTPAISGTLSAVQKLTMASSIFEGIPTSGATQAQINKMPYVLHLPHVKVTSDGKLQSIEGNNDARLLLKRLATKLTVNWSLDAALPQDYLLKEVKLCQIPAIFGILPAKENTEWGTTWPSTVTEFVEPYRLTDAADLAKGTKTIWIPANVRGASAKATSPYYRTKDNAPAAASYMELVLDNSVKKERLYYRAYLGGVEPTDFNLYENTDYNWTINIKSANYQTDNRIQLLDQTPVVSTNLVPTSNCFMMPPGTNICFNPYKHEAGTNGWNEQLVNNPSGTPSAKSAITSVKVLWQTKDAGTSGELVLGYVVDGTHHENLVNIENASDINNARISIKVPQTQGGNAVVAAYDNSNNVLWSWHIWVTDYVPVTLQGEINANTRAAAISAAQKATRNGAVQVYQGISWTDPEGSFYKSVIMDRNLGAIRAGIQNNPLDGVRTFGLLYQGGRKDPFFSTADGTTEEKKTIYDGYGVQVNIARGNLKSLVDLVRKPLTFNLYNNSNYNSAGHWNGGGTKTIYDPCPDGWRVPSNGVSHATSGSTTDVMTKKCMMAGFGSSDPSLVYEATAPVFNNVMYYNGTGIVSITKAEVESSTFVGSGIVYYGTNSGPSGDTSIFFPGVSLREQSSGNYRLSAKNNTVFLWSSTKRSSNGELHIYQIAENKLSFRHTVGCMYGFSVRCVQDR